MLARPSRCWWRQGVSAKLVRFVVGTLQSLPIRSIATGQMGAPLMFTYIPDVLTYLAFGGVMAACPWNVDGSLKDDAD